MQKFAENIELKLLKELGQALDIDLKDISKHKIIQSIKRLKWERQKRMEPIFIERIKIK